MPPSTLALLLSMVIFTTAVIRAGGYKLIISKRGQESTKIESKHIEYNKSGTVLIICLFPSPVSSSLIPVSVSWIRRSGFINNAIGLFFYRSALARYKLKEKQLS